MSSLTNTCFCLCVSSNFFTFFRQQQVSMKRRVNVMPLIANQPPIKIMAVLRTYRSFATRVPQFKIWHFWVIGIQGNVCRCTFKGYSVITQFCKTRRWAAVCLRCVVENYSASNPLKGAPTKKEKNLSCDTVVANERYALRATLVWL